MMPELNVFGSFVRVPEDCVITMLLTCEMSDKNCLEVNIIMTFNQIVFNPTFRYVKVDDINNDFDTLTEEQSFEICKNCVDQLWDKHILTNRFLYRTIVSTIDGAQGNYFHETDITVQ